MGWGPALATVAAEPFPKTLLHFSFFFRVEANHVLFSRIWGYTLYSLLNTLVTKREPAPGFNDVYSVETPKWALVGEYGQTQRKTTFPPTDWRVLLVSRRTLVYFWTLVVWMLLVGRARHPGPG